MSVLVTGGTSGIGLAIAERLATTGTDVIVNFHSDEQAAHNALRVIETRGARAHAVKADVGTLDGVRLLIERVRAVGGQLDVLVHGAAATYPGNLLDLDPAELERSVMVNGLALAHLAREAADLLGPGSSVVYLSSQGARTVIRGYAALGVAKALGEHIVRYLAVELARRGVRVNTIAPGMLDTKAVRAMFPGRYERVAEAAAKQNPSSRSLEFDDVAGMVELLCRPEFAMMQGQTVSIDGGASLR